MNLFFEKYNTIYNSIPFSKIKTEEYIPAFEEGIKQAEKEIENIISNNETPSFKNVIEAMDDNGEILNRVSKVFFNLLHSNTTKEMQKMAQEISPKLSKLYNDKILNEELFKKVKFVIIIKKTKH